MYYNTTNMSQRIPAQLKKQLGELLASWYSKLGKVAPRRAYHEDDEGGEGSSTLKMFEDHPFLSEMPIGAPSDLASVIIEDKRTLDEADKRSKDLTPELQNKLTLALGQKLKLQQKKQYQEAPRPY
jgi:hypothetical protein